MSENLQRVDHSALKANQLTIIFLAILGFVLNLPWVAALIAVVMLLGTLWGIPGFLWVYRYLLVPAGILTPNIYLDHPEPHRFAQGFGGLVMLGASIAFWAGLPVLAWSLVWLVVALAALNAFAGFCAGCFVYYWLSRLHFPGFSKAPPAGTFPGTRPKQEAGHES